MLTKSILGTLLLLSFLVLGLSAEDHYKIYKVKPGDNYYVIGKKFKINYPELLALNKNKKLRAGTEIKIPDYFQYKIKKGDNYYKLSNKFKVPVRELMKMNPNKKKLLIGMIIDIPSEKSLTVEADTVVLDQNPTKKFNKSSNSKNSKKNKSAKKTSPEKKEGISEEELITIQSNENRQSVLELSKNLRFVWPVNASIEKNYGLDEDILNQGILLKLDSAKSAVLASESGKVLYTGHLRGFGKSIIIAHSDTIFSAYLGVDEILTVENQSKTKGSVLARSGERIFFSIFVKGNPENPMWLLSKTIN